MRRFHNHGEGTYIIIIIIVTICRFDKKFAGNQKLVTQFRNVERVAFQGLHVDEAIEVGQWWRQFMSSRR